MRLKLRPGKRLKLKQAVRVYHALIRRGLDATLGTDDRGYAPRSGVKDIEYFLKVQVLGPEYIELRPDGCGAWWAGRGTTGGFFTGKLRNVVRDLSEYVTERRASDARARLRGLG